MRKKTVKKVMTVLTGMLLVISLSACGNEIQEEQKAESQPEQQVEDRTEVSMEDTGQVSAEGGKTLVVYYSATGHTETVAGYIAAETDGDIFELEPVEPYSSDDLDWTDKNSRVSYEHDHPESRNVELVSAAVEDWESYDTVFIGYPIWWHIAAWPVDGFIAANDFTGKTVIPFCTSSSSDLGESGELLAQAAGTGNWLEGERFASGTSEETVRAWVEGLGLRENTEFAVVYFTSDISPKGLMAVYEALNWEPTGKVAVKLSTGEPPASHYLDPQLIKDLVESVDGTIVECNTVYGGSRTETAMHMRHDWLAAFMMSSVLLNPQLLFYSTALGKTVMMVRLVSCTLCGITAGLLVHYGYGKELFFDFTGFEPRASRDTDPNLLMRFLKNLGRNIRATALCFLIGILLSAQQKITAAVKKSIVEQIRAE